MDCNILNSFSKFYVIFYLIIYHILFRIVATVFFVWAINLNCNTMDIFFHCEFHFYFCRSFSIECRWSSDVQCVWPQRPTRVTSTGSSAFSPCLMWAIPTRSVSQLKTIRKIHISKFLSVRLRFLLFHTRSHPNLQALLHDRLARVMSTRTSRSLIFYVQIPSSSAGVSLKLHWNRSHPGGPSYWKCCSIQIYLLLM